MSLFAAQEEAALKRALPLAARMRPRDLDEFVGQQEFLGPGRLLRRLLEADRLSSAIFFGPSGTGKTSLAHLIAAQTRSEFFALHAAEASVKDVREVIEAARGRLKAGGRRTLLFLDEIHRFNRAQQDVLLKDVEEGVLILLGATTENPFFAVNGPLLSRSNIFEFKPLVADDLRNLLLRALTDAERGLAGTGATADEAALNWIANHAEGDARRALHTLEVAVLSQVAEGHAPHVTPEIAAESMQRKVVPYDASGDVHYDVTSAFIKSMRGSDPDAALYWLARMIEGGEDPRFIARRIAIAASEDVGNADPRAVVIAAAALTITQAVGLPECQYALAQAAVYNACALKSNAVTAGLAAAQEDVRNNAALPVPSHLRDGSYKGAAKLGRGTGYVSPHTDPSGFLQQDYLGTPRRYYEPLTRGEEARIAARLAELRQELPRTAVEKETP